MAGVNTSENNAIMLATSQQGVSTGAGPNIVVIPYAGAGSFTATQGALGSGTVPGPDGVVNADTFTDNNTTNVHSMAQTAATTVPNGSLVQLVTYAKGTAVSPILGFGQSGGSIFCVFDLIGGDVLNVPALNTSTNLTTPIWAGIRSVGSSFGAVATNLGSWFRLQVTFLASNALLGQAAGATVTITPTLYSRGGSSYLGTTSVCFSIAKPPLASVPLNYAEMVAQQNTALLANGSFD